MPAAYSIDLRQRLVDAYHANEGSQRHLAKRFRVSLSFVRNLLRHYRQTGAVKPQAHGGGAMTKITASDLLKLKQLIEQQPDALLNELCERFEQRYGIDVSVSTMHRAVRRLGISTKKNF